LVVIRARGVEGSGGKGDMRGMKCIIALFGVKDSGVGAVNTATSELRTRYPDGFSEELLWVRPLTFFVVRGGEREVAREA